MTLIYTIVNKKNEIFNVKFDASEYDLLKSMHLRASKKSKNTYYIQGHFIGTCPKKCYQISRIIARAKQGQVVDHINGDTLDNRKENLRVCYQKENLLNRAKSTNKKCSSIFKGVGFVKREKVWRARVYKNKKYVFTGYYKSEIEAAIAYNKNALLHFGKFAKLNNVQQIKRGKNESTRNYRNRRKDHGEILL